MKKTIIYLVAIFAFVLAQRALCQPTPPANEAIKLLWQGGSYSGIYPTYDSKIIYANYKFNEVSNLVKIDAVTGVILDTNLKMKSFNLNIQEFSIGNNDDIIFMIANHGTGTNDSVYKYSYNTNELKTLKIQYSKNHILFYGLKITNDNKIFYITDRYSENINNIYKTYSSCIIYDIQGDTIKNYAQYGDYIEFNSKGDKFYAYNGQDLKIAECYTETGELIRFIEHGLTFIGIDELSISNDDKYLIANDLGGFTAIYNLNTNLIEFNDRIGNVGIPILFKVDKFMLKFNRLPMKDCVYNWKSKEVKFEIPYTIWGDKYLRDNLLIMYGENLQVYQLDFNLLDVTNTLPKGIIINCSDNGDSNYQIYINSDKFFKMELQISNITGNIIRKETKLINEGNNIIDCNLVSLPIGSYFINLKADGINKTIKILKEQ